MADSEKVLAVIPARRGSTRFPAKMLAPLAGRPLIEHVVEWVRRAQRIPLVVVATDDAEIKKTVDAFGGEAILTRRDHRSGTDRVAEVAAHLPADIYINVQGDWLIAPETLDALVTAMLEEDWRVGTSCVAIKRADDIANPNIVKVARDFDGNALYFSRAPIPWVRDTNESAASRHFKHLGLYAFRREALLEFPTLPPGELERTEHLEQLRWLENGFRIGVLETEHDAVSVDVPADIERAEKMLAAKSGK